MARGASESKTIMVREVNTETKPVMLVGVTPLILNRMSEKAKRELLFPGGADPRKGGALKHVPLDEYRASAYIMPSESEALLAIPASAVKGSMMTAALDLPDAKKAQIGRLVYVNGDYLPIYGIPRLFMSITRSAGMGHTPDVRTRAIVPEWCVFTTITYVTPILNFTSILNLLSAGGVTAGIGDFRQEKGKGNFGRFKVVGDPQDAEVRRIVASGGRVAQQEALDNPQCYDDDTEQLLEWYAKEVVLRGKEDKPMRGKRAAKGIE